MMTENSTRMFHRSGRFGRGYRPRRATSAVLLLALLALLATTFRPAGAVVPGSEFVVSDNSGDKVSPSVSGGLVVWEDKRHGNSDVYGKRLAPAGGAEFQITSHAGNQRRPSASGEFVVWEDDRNGNWDIYGKDLSLGPDSPEIPIVVAPGDQRKPKISGKKVVWEDGRKSTATGFDLDVYYKDLATDPQESTGHEIPAPAGNQSNPAISGNTVVWEDDRTGQKNIYGKDLASPAEEFPVGTGSAWQDQPAISGSLVVWRQDNQNNYDIFGKDLMAKDLETGAVFQITTNTADQYSPAISGTVVVWADGRNGNSDTYGKDLATGREFQVTGDANPQDTPAIDGETVVWEDQRVGATNYGTWDIRGSNLDAAPSAPAQLGASRSGQGVDLTWTANTTDADLAGYNVYRADSQGGPFTKLNGSLLPASTTSYADAAAPQPGNSFYYQVKAQDAAGSESAATVAHITTPAATPPPPPPSPVVQTPPPPPPPPPVVQPSAPAPVLAPPQVVISNPKPVVPVRKLLRITVRNASVNVRPILTVTRDGKVVLRKTVRANSTYSFKPASAGKYTVKATASNRSHSKTFRAR